MAKYFDAEGNEVEAVPVDEVQKIQQERDKLSTDYATLAEEKKRLEEGSLDKNENLKKMRESLESKDKERDEAIKRLQDKDENDKKTVKENFILHYAGTDAELRKKFEDEYAIIGIDETTPENMARRAEKAARVSGLFKEKDSENPVFKGSIWGGAAPFLKPTKASEDDADNVVNTDKGKSALGAMGVPADYGVKK